jgi:hypothetical protein
MPPAVLVEDLDLWLLGAALVGAALGGLLTWLLMR